MRSRRSRFFVMLVHLLGVSLPHQQVNTKHQYTGRGVSATTGPAWPMALERIRLDESSRSDDDRRRNKEKRRRKRRRPQRESGSRAARVVADTTDDEESSSSPLWLQNSLDGSCLGPLGTFSECGDATLWWMERYPHEPRIRRKLSHRIPSHGYVFRVVDHDASMATTTQGAFSNSSSFHSTMKQSSSECLSALGSATNSSTAPITKATATATATANSHSSLQISQCPPIRLSRTRWWKKQRPTADTSILWTITADGNLQHTSLVPATAAMSIDEYEHAAMIPVSTCVAKQSRGNQAVLVDCNGSAEDQSASAHSRPVQFAFFRYRPVAVSTLEHHRRGGASSSNEKLAIRTHSQHSPLSEEQHLRQHDPPLHPDLKSASELIFDLRTKHLSSADPQQSPLMRRVVWDANPHLLATRLDRARPEKPLSTTPSPDDGNTVVDVQAMKLRRIQTHPYLAEAKDGIWTDPQTNLQFFTDLCKYLGRNCNEQGRHTLTGMGIYRKGYVIKVYGIAYYVSKRDVVADPSMEQFATLTAEQLRARPDFYEKLRKLGHFDRTILLKTNMQLSAETMRSSLQADWSYLTEEAKSTLVGVSMNARPADEAMLALIQSPDNPSRCSCSQTAPPEYNANPDCCARGTELAFTWTKFNDLEVRLNGRLMEAFPRPDIAEGIFYEYLRYDDPISPELLDRVVDGFPFLLGPIAGINGQMDASSSENGGNHMQAMFEAMTSWKDSFVWQAMEFGDTVKRSASDAADHAGNAAKAFGVAAKDFAVEADRRRDLFVKHTVAAPTTLMKLLARDEATVQSFSQWMSGETGEPDVQEVDVEALLSSERRLSRGRIFGYSLSRWYGEEYYAPDEIGPMRIHPTINKFFLTLVHLYLLLLFIVSFPGSSSTRTKLVSRKSAYSDQDDSESDISEENDASSAEPIPSFKDMYGSGTRGFFTLGRQSAEKSAIQPATSPIESGFKKKSLSYFL